MSDFELTPEILEQFQMESRENLAHAEAALLSLSKSKDASEAIHELFRSIHTIKGSADYLGLKALKELSHAFENILDHLRKFDTKSLLPDQADVFFNVLDVMSDLVSNAPDLDEKLTGNCRVWIERLGHFRAPETLAIPQIAAPESRSLKVFRDTIGQQCDVLLRAKVKLRPDHSIDPAVRGMVSRALQCISNACQFVGEEDLIEISKNLRSWALSPAESRDPVEFVGKLDEYLAQVQVALLSVVEGVGKPSETPALATSPATDLAPVLSILESTQLTDSKTVRVDQSALDGFMNLVGELIVARNAFSHIQAKLVGTEDERQVALREFRESSTRLEHITGVLQRNVMEMRMVPITTLFERFPRIVRDVCRKKGKSVEVVFEGESTEVDKGIADQISESLIHLIRNAVDHGIESSEERSKNGKSPTGTIIMKASHQGNFMVIEVTDDGGGIDLERIRSKVVERGLLRSDQAQKASKAEILNYIFSPGFSTAVAVTDISGRGVGLDVVSTNLKKVKGNVSVSTELNQGTCFRLEVPLTMAIMRALLVKSDQAIYAISLQDVSETVKIRYDELKSIRQKNAITLRGEVIMVEWLSQLLGHPLRDDLSPDLRIPVLILHGNGRKFGLIVDSVFRQEEIVVKPLPESYAGLQGLAGASILGDGKAILILDSNQLYGCMADRCPVSEEVTRELNIAAA